MDSSSYDSKEHKEVAQTNCFNISNDGIFEFEGRCNGANSYSFLDDTPLDDLINHLLLHLTTNHLLLHITTSSILSVNLTMEILLLPTTTMDQDFTLRRLQLIISLLQVVKVSSMHSSKITKI